MNENWKVKDWFGSRINDLKKKLGETYYEIDEKIYTVLNNKNNHGIYTNKWYAFIIEKQLVFFYRTSKRTLKFFFANSGFTWSITKNGKTNLDRAWDKLDAMKQLYSIADEYLSN